MSDEDLHWHSHRPYATGALSRRRFLKRAAAIGAVPLIGNSGVDPLLAQQSDGTPLGVLGQRRSDSTIWKSLRRAAGQMTIFDTHEHLWHEDVRLAKKVDLFLLFSHYTDDDLISAGMAQGLARSLFDSSQPLEKRWTDFAPYWPHTRTTGYGRCVLIAARDLFGVEDINEKTYIRLSERIAAANRPGWYETVLKQKARIELSVLDDTTTMRGEPLKPNPKFFKLVTRYDYFLSARRRADLDYIEKVTNVAIGSLADLEKALEKAVQNGVAQGLAGIKCAIAYDRTLQFEKISRPDAERAFERQFASGSQTPDPANRKVYQDYMMRRVVQQAAEHRLPMQIHTGFQAFNSNHVSWTNPAHLSDLLNEYKQVRFDIFHGGYPFGGELATLAKNLPNVYPDLCWLHIIAPGVAKRSLHDLIETVPANKILGFGGDFFHAEGAYAHAQMARAITAEVLAEKVEQGYLREEEAPVLLDRILYRNGKELFAKV